MNSGKFILQTLIAVALWPFPSFADGESAQSFTLDGQLYGDAAATTPLTDTGTLTLQILEPTQTCVLYEESQTFDTRLNNGSFIANVGSALGAPKRSSLDVNNGMGLVYSNVNAIGISGKLAGGGACTYVPQAGDVRYLRTIVHTDTDGLTRTLSPDLKIDSAPSAIGAERAESLQGLAPANFLRLSTTGNPNLTQTNVETVFSSFSTLQSLLAGTSTSYMQSGAGLATLPQPTTPPTNATATANEGRIWYDSPTHSIRYSDGTAIRALIDAGDLGTAAQQLVQLNGSAQSLLSAGSAAAPTYSFGGSSGTGVFSPGTNQLALATNGTSALVIGANGNVGIGTSTPGAALEVARTMPATGGSSNYGMFSNSIAAPGAASSATYRSLYNLTQWASAANSPSATVEGLRGEVGTAWIGSVGTVLGVGGSVYHGQASTISSASGLKGDVTTLDASAVVTTAKSGWFSVTRTAGTITNAYGVYVDTVQGTNKWSVYASDATAPSYFAGGIGVATSTPRATLDVAGTILNAPAVANASTTINFGGGNVQYTTQSCQAFELDNLKDGGAYVLTIKGTASATCSFTAFSYAGSGALTYHAPPNHSSTIAGKHTVYNFLVVGTDVYASWTPGY